VAHDQVEAHLLQVEQALERGGNGQVADGGGAARAVGEVGVDAVARRREVEAGGSGGDGRVVTDALRRREK